MKVVAYTGQNNNEIVTALRAKKGNTFYSCHKPGERLEMIKMQRGHTHYFAYKSKSDHERKTAPETLTHTLCKQVIVELAQNRAATHLKFFNTFGPYKDRDDEPIIFDGGAAEKTVQVGEHRYVIDALCHFKSPPDSSPLFSLEQRWNGLIAFEIYHTSKLSSNSSKCRDLESIGIPVIQIATGDPKSALFLNEEEVAKMNEEDADLTITKHLDKLRRIFSKSIGGVVYNDPKSLIYLAAVKLTRKLNTLQNELADAKILIEQKEKEISDFKSKVEYLENQYAHLSSESHSLHTKIIESDRRYAREADQNKELKAYIIQLQQDNKISWISKIIRRLWK